MDEEKQDSWERINGKIEAGRDPVTGEITLRWEGGVIIGLTRDLLLSCDRELVVFEGEMPKVGETVQIGAFKTRAFNWDGNLLLCVRERFADEGMVPA